MGPVRRKEAGIIGESTEQKADMLREVPEERPREPGGLRDGPSRGSRQCAFLSLVCYLEGHPY